ncbi:GNAT family N-acetyltransferase [Janthinobacterium agaricidamnosum]|uniref:Acetyltransferase family protein n=1 Tax=Janthinobacterium agaricidamnosum NBRC 102515 = DSM 9628 TaxID=1349767 RepID=W0V8J4_9BURK|nr:GNAT family protein [Janthinobacterium agaricidamnosum]CDG84206.1 acetyltransferase family protein [Janthinobacterium agaricidamnosum NBRC 102515 = DSM 9628]
MPYFKTLSTARLTLRPPRHGDEESLFRLHSDAQVMRYFSEPPWTDPARAARQVEDDVGAFGREEYLRFCIVLNGTQQMIGNCTLFALHRQNRRGEIGYALDRACWGQGYMHEALDALLEYAFVERDLHRLEADVDPRNSGSAHCLQRLGFSAEGLLRERWIVGGQVSDSALYGLLRRDWQARRG